jgi:predicted O-linked N-acetylglucosamine transferase (SPINDLY family)
MRERLKAAFERFIDVRQRTDREVAALLRDLEVDVAVDLNGHTQGSRLGALALRPCPVQVSYLGYPGTTGAEYVDYALADRFVVPEAQLAHFAEKVVYLPDTFQANDRRRTIAASTPTRAEVGLPERGFVFCAFSNAYKITPAVFDVWMRLLQRCEGSMLWLQGSEAAAGENLRREARGRGVDPQRLVFARRLPYAEHLARYRLADLFLDTMPFNGGATASDALWAGLPVLTCTGEAMAARMAGSLLHAAGMPELVTASLADYEALAHALAHAPPRVAALKATLARARDSCALFDTDRFRRHLEAAYVAMWEGAQRGEAPAGFAVPAIA